MRQCVRLCLLFFLCLTAVRAAGLEIAGEPLPMAFDTVRTADGEWLHVARAPHTGSTITVVSTLELDENIGLLDMEELWLAGLAGARGVRPDQLALAWRMEQSSFSFFPLWKLVLYAATEGGPIEHELVSAQPRRGHTYRTLLSVDGATGTVALRVEDVTSGNLLYSGGFSLGARRGPFYPLAGGAFASEAAHVRTQLTVYGPYLPVGTTVGFLGSEGRPITPRLLSRQAETWVQLRAPTDFTQGTYRLAVVYEGRERQIDLGPVVPVGGEAEVPLLLHQLPVGRARLVWTYETEGGTIVDDSLTFTNGWISVEFGPARVDPRSREVRVTARLATDAADLAPAVTLRSTLTRLEFERAAGVYREVAATERHTVFEAVALNEGTLELPLSIVLPQGEPPARWMLRFHAEADQAVDVRTLDPEMIFFYDANPDSPFYAAGGTMQRRADVPIRDPFILPMPEQGIYYMYGTTGARAEPRGPFGIGFDAYVSTDLEMWYGPIAVFRPEPDFWADRDYWAPEVHEYQGRYYMFATFNAPGRRRGTQILVADSPLGPFTPHSDGPVTPEEFEALDGTLYVAEDGVPWMVFCREWLQVQDGEMWAVPLTPDLSAPAGPPEKLFAASDAPWSRVSSDQVNFVTDGPWLHRTPDGTLLMLWSSFTPRGYALGLAYSETGLITGPWRHHPEPLFSADGGHGMLFRTFDGELMLALHAPNSQRERPHFLPVREWEGRLELATTD